MSMFKRITLGERFVWAAAAALLVYGTITGTNWYHQYHQYKSVAESVDEGAIAKAEAYDKLKTEFATLQGELEEKNATIEQLKGQTLR